MYSVDAKEEEESRRPQKPQRHSLAEHCPSLHSTGRVVFGFPDIYLDVRSETGSLHVEEMIWGGLKRVISCACGTMFLSKNCPLLKGELFSRTQGNTRHNQDSVVLK